MGGAKERLFWASPQIGGGTFPLATTAPGVILNQMIFPLLRIRFVIKELRPRDHEVLLRITEDLATHLSLGRTLLAKTFMHFQVDVGRYGFFVVMENCLPWKGNYTAIFDLKGCNDDKLIVGDGAHIEAEHRRCWEIHKCWPFSICTWDDTRRLYWEGKYVARMLQLRVTKNQRDSLLDHMAQDLAFLECHNLMDYSLLVGIICVSKKELQQRPGEIEELMATIRKNRDVRIFMNTVEGIIQIFFLGIIDVLEAWTCRKRTAMMIKCLECNKATVPPAVYARRFLGYFEDKLVPTARMALSRNFATDDNLLYRRQSSMLAWLYMQAASDKLDNENEEDFVHPEGHTALHPVLPIGGEELPGPRTEVQRNTTRAYIIANMMRRASVAKADVAAQQALLELR